MTLRFLLFQIRRPNDPMRANEVAAFSWALGCPRSQITVIDLINDPPGTATLAAHDMVIIGGAGDFSVPKGGPWLEGALDAMRTLDALSKPAFASCWGFQALARALGGTVVTDHGRAELGTLMLQLTESGLKDPLFRQLGTSFYAQVGHHDTVDVLPPNAISLARSSLVDNHAFRIAGKPIYATQFHPELRPVEMKQRLRSYPQYVKNIAGVSVDTFFASLRETPKANNLLKAFVTSFFGA